MKRWIKQTALAVEQTPSRPEIWQYLQGDQVLATFPVEVSIGKPLDILGLKGTSLEEIRQYADFLQKTADILYAPGKGGRDIAFCPCCDWETGKAAEEFAVFGVPYHKCPQCQHVFVRRQPTAEALDEVFRDSEEHAAVYTDKKSLEFRLEHIIGPKLTWAAQVFRQHFGRELKTVLDVGAGGGHFVEVCRRRGLAAAGYEISRSSRRFAREVFGVELTGEDFLSLGEADTGYDLITFWGLLEYTPEPKKFLQTAARFLVPGGGMLITEVPRYHCLSTAIQQACPRNIARHMDPTSHVNCFSDASLATALVNSGFRPVNLWYFGMDAYEVLVNLALELDDDHALAKWADHIPLLQSFLDAAQLCDDIVVAAVPLK